MRSAQDTAAPGCQQLYQAAPVTADSYCPLWVGPPSQQGREAHPSTRGWTVPSTSPLPVSQLLCGGQCCTFLQCPGRLCSLKHAGVVCSCVRYQAAPRVSNQRHAAAAKASAGCIAVTTGLLPFIFPGTGEASSAAASLQYSVEMPFL